MTALDEFSGRPVAADAVEVLEEFRAAGARSFHNFDVAQVRERYEQGCAANGLSGDSLHAVTDHRVGQFGVRVYEPRPTRGPTRVTLFFHGGGWVMGSLDTHDGLCRRLASLTGHPVVAVDYRLAPEHRYPAALEDCREALYWLLSEDAAHGLTVASVVLAGDSAGGQLAAVLANENARCAAPLPLIGQVLLYPITDLSFATPSYQRVTEGFPLVADTMRWFADLYLPEGTDRRAPELSPAFAALRPGSPPAYVVTVDNDPLADEGARYAAALAQAGTAVCFRHLSGYAHGLFTSAGRIARAGQEVEHIAAFIGECAHRGLP
ncbi:alpha/beta hydrolase [Kocuria sp. cx-455]|uniref:alpha/beta hydrolase n=1 Tax=Kocuria sp. cx-455 TaxID=2771377 RepID=UPI003D73DD90